MTAADRRLTIVRVNRLSALPEPAATWLIKLGEDNGRIKLFAGNVNLSQSAPAPGDKQPAPRPPLPRPATGHQATQHLRDSLALAHQLGALKPGYRADVVLLDAQLQVVATVVGGQVVYLREPARFVKA